MEPKFGDQIRSMRKARGISQIDLANKSNIAVNSLRRYEANERQPTMDILVKIAAALDMDVQELLWGSPSLTRSFFWTVELEEKLKQVGFNFGVIESEGYLWIDYPDGTLEVTEEELIELHINTNSYMKFKLEELKQKHIKDFKLKKQ